jgi:hypothetical protein
MLGSALRADKTARMAPNDADALARASLFPPAQSVPSGGVIERDASSLPGVPLLGGRRPAMV